jgi:hypothetical protein
MLSKTEEEHRLGGAVVMSAVRQHAEKKLMHE